MIEEKVGRQYADDMTPARASRIRAERIEGSGSPVKELREAAAEIKWTVDRLWQEYIGHKPKSKGLRQTVTAIRNYLNPPWGKEPKDIAQIDIHRLRITLAKT